MTEIWSCLPRLLSRKKCLCQNGPNKFRTKTETSWDKLMVRMNKELVRNRNFILTTGEQSRLFFFFSFRPFPSVRGGHSISSSSKPLCLQHPPPLHQLPPYLLLLHLQIFSLVSLFFSFPVTPLPSSFFLHTLGLSS